MGMRNYAFAMPIVLRLIASALLCLAPAAMAQSVPAPIARQLPAGYEVFRTADARFDGRHFHLVALRHRDEKNRARPAPARPFLIFERRPAGSYILAGRNDHVVLRADEGGQCDPFEDGGITAKGRYFTVENVVACGQHWTAFATFRFDSARNGFVFDNLRTESWSPNPSRAPDADALISSGVDLVRARPGRPVRFADWRPSGN